MGDGCGGCKTMEEETYWKFFQTVQFSQILSGHFQHQLEVPKKFANNLREKPEKEVSLKVPSGATWKVGLVTERDSLNFKVGWKEFIEDNSLEENDILIFRYSGSSVFDVLLFDGKSSCEKAGSYFVRKCSHPSMAGQGRREEKESSEFTSGKVLRRRQPPEDEDIEEAHESFQFVSGSENDNSTEWTPESRWDDAVKSGSIKRRGAADRKFCMRKMNSTPAVPSVRLAYISNRRPVTEEEKSNAAQRANAAASIESLVIVMKEYNVNKHFFLTLPAWWSNDRLPKRNVALKLQVKGVVWPVNYCKRTGGGMIVGGWKKFVLDNILEEADACLFNLVSENSSPITMDVQIFRVVEEVVPPTPPCPPSSSHRGRKRGRKPY